MFEKLIQELKCMNEMSVSVGIETDENGYIDKQCPNENCEFVFKVNKEDWANIFKDESVWCPLCRHEAPSDQWFTLQQIEHAQSEALAIVEGKIDNSLREGANQFNQRQRKNSFISLSMKVSGSPKRTFTIPAKAADLMQLEIQCEACNSRFAVIGSAYFCPACGHNSVTRTFRDSLRKIHAKKNSIDVVRRAVIESSGKDEAELMCRSLIETCVSDGVVAFQKYCEGMYEQFATPPFNAFQRLAQSNELWKNVFQKGFETWLSENEIKCLGILYQKRHLLAHNEGIVDTKYIHKSGDETYKEGQRVVISSKDIDFLVYCLEKLADGIEFECRNLKKRDD